MRPDRVPEDLRRSDGDATAAGAREEASVLPVFLLALVVRLAMVLPQMPAYLGTSAIFDQYAIRIAAGLGYGPSSLLPPLYPHFLGMLYRLYGYSQHPVVLSQAFLGAVLAALTVLLARAAELPRRQAMVAGIFAALFPQAVAESRHLTPQILTAVVFTLGAWMWLRRAGLPARRESFLGGLALGVAVLGRLGAILPAAFLVFSRGREVARAERTPGWSVDGDLWMRKGIVLLAIFTVVAPWVSRNTRLHERPVLVESTWALRLRATTVPGSPPVAFGLPPIAAQVPDNLVLTENDFALFEVLGYATSRPAPLAGTMLRRVSRYFSFSAASDAAANDPIPYRFRWYRALQAAAWGVLLTLVLAWMLLSRAPLAGVRTCAATAVGFAVLAVLVGGAGDARLFAVPFLSVVAAAGVGALRTLARPHPHPRLAEPDPPFAEPDLPFAAPVPPIAKPGLEERDRPAAISKRRFALFVVLAALVWIHGLVAAQ